jgi:hypothetical protein
LGKTPKPDAIEAAKQQVLEDQQTALPDEE